jgi:hypothetical protein
MPRYSAEYWDHRRDELKHEPRPTDQRFAAADLIGYCEGIVSSGALAPDIEAALRLRIARALVAFNMPSKVEREAAHA